MSSVFSVFSLFLVLNVVIVAHVLGHFIGARLVGVRVLSLSLGFGPKLKARLGQTDYCIGAVPVGVYLKMAGKDADEPRTGAPDEFVSKTKLQRFLVLIMGFVMSILLAILLQAVAFSQDYVVPGYMNEAPVVGLVSAGSPAERAGLQVGDRITSVGSSETHTWEALDTAFGVRPDREVTVAFLRRGEKRSVRLRPVRQAGQAQYDIARTIGIRPNLFPVITQTVPGDPADKAGLRVGDEIRAVDGVRMVFPDELRAAISRKPGVEVDLTIARSGVEQHIRVTPVDRDGRGAIGVMPTVPTKTIARGPIAALHDSLLVNYQATVTLFNVVRDPPVGANSNRQPRGPISIAPMSSTEIQRIIAPLLSFVALLSLMFGFFSLLPVPVICDGWRILGLLVPDSKNKGVVAA